MRHAVTSVLLALAMRGNADAPPCGVTIIAYNFRNSHGTAAIAIYADAEGFPDAPEKAVRKTLAPIEHGFATVTVSDLEPGTYAVVVLHDENQNGKMDKTYWAVQKNATASPTMPNRKRLARPHSTRRRSRSIRKGGR
jgi:uncharacterized protein (DUF2141 family)